MLCDDLEDNQPRLAPRIGVGDGVSDEKPIGMDGHMATSNEFDALLDLIYNGCVDSVLS